VGDQESRKRRAASARPQVCVIDSREVGLAYARLDECRLDVMGSLPSLTQLTAATASAYDAILVGCSERLLLSPPFRTRAHQLSRAARLIALMASPTAEAGAQAASLGFVGLVSSDVTPRALERTIAATALGESAFPRTVLNGLVQMVSRLGSTRFGPYSDVALTPRQEQIVELIAQGATDREIAAVLQISQSTAHKHVQNALRRLNAKTRSQLVASARQPAFRGSFD